MRVDEPRVAIVLVLILTLGTVGGTLAAASLGGRIAGATTGDGPTDVTAPPDPASDVVGWENGYWYNESIDVNQRDGLSKHEQTVFKARTMARVEHLTGLEFTRDVRVEYVSERELNRYIGEDVTQLPGNDQLWEALFVFGEDTNASRAVYRSLTASVGGMAAEEGVDHVVIPVADPSAPQVAHYVLAHELVHMLQDQHYDLSQPRFHRRTLNGEMAKDSVVEGVASYVDYRYRQRCSDGAWQCVPLPADSYVGSGSPDPAFSRLMSFPYTDGRAYVQHLKEQGGWARVDSRYGDLPASVKPVIHYGAAGETPPPIPYENTSHNGWHLADPRPTTVGEAGIYVLFWNQAARQDRKSVV